MIPSVLRDHSAHVVPRVLITGGAGFIGSHLARRVLQRGWAVTLADNLSTGRVDNIAGLRTDPRVHLSFVDVGDFDMLDAASKGCQAIFHLAAAVGVDFVMHHPAETIHINVSGTESVLRLAANHGIPVFLASTSEVYGKGSRLPFSEDDDVLIGPTSMRRWSYAASKMIDEFLALAYTAEGRAPVVVFRLFNTVGPRQTGRYGMVLPRFVDAALRGAPLEVYGDGTQSRCFLHVEDAVTAILALSDCPEAFGEVFNVGATEPVTIRELASRVIEKVEEHTGVNGGHIVFRDPAEVLGPGYEDVHGRIPDLSKIRRYTGWEPTRSLSEILDDLILDMAAGHGIPTRHPSLTHVGPGASAIGTIGNGDAS